jgi:predicted porin
MLLRYTYLHDLPGEDQVTASGSVDGPLQKSHVISVDANYDLSPKLTVGGKYGYRKSQVAARGTDMFTDSTAHLGILRLDWHVVQKWDVMAETRILFAEQSDVSETGSLIGIYRHFNNNAKLGLGYEWGKVSDDMTDLDYVSRGVFLNVIAKF